MSDSVAYKNKSIININSDNFVVNTGTVTRQNKTLVLNANSRCTFTYNYSSDKPLSSTHLKCVYDINNNNSNRSTRYSNNFQINLKIHYYESKYDETQGKEVYSNGKIETIQVMPYSNNENTGAYKFEEINLDTNYIKKIEVIIAYYNSADLNSRMTINILNLFPTVVGSEQSINEDIDDNYINDLIEQYMDEHPTQLIIPLVSVLPDISTVPDGYICRLY